MTWTRGCCPRPSRRHCPRSACPPRTPMPWAPEHGSTATPCCRPQPPPPCSCWPPPGPLSSPQCPAGPPTATSRSPPTPARIAGGWCRHPRAPWTQLQPPTASLGLGARHPRAASGGQAPTPQQQSPCAARTRSTAARAGQVTVTAAATLGPAQTWPTSSPMGGRTGLRPPCPRPGLPDASVVPAMGTRSERPGRAPSGCSRPPTPVWGCPSATGKHNGLSPPSRLGSWDVRRFGGERRMCYGFEVNLRGFGFVSNLHFFCSFLPSCTTPFSGWWPGAWR